MKNKSELPPGQRDPADGQLDFDDLARAGQAEPAEPTPPFRVNADLGVPQPAKNHFSNTDGNEAMNPDVGKSSFNTSSENLANQKLDSEFEPTGSQQYQYNGKFVPYLPMMNEPEPAREHAEYRDRLNPEDPPAARREPQGGENPQGEQQAPRSCMHKVPYYTWVCELMDTFDGPFIVLLGVQNINHGLWTVAILACQDLYKQYLHLNPGTMTLYMSMIHIPWSVKILYGLISDNVPIAGTRRKSYIVMMGALQFVALISIYMLNQTGAVPVAVFLTLAALSEAFVNVVADAIMCVQARKDPEHGSQNLIAFSWMATGVGGIMGCVLGGVMTQYCHPRYSFLAYSFMGLVVAVNGTYLTRASEEDAPVERNAEAEADAGEVSSEESTSSSLQRRDQEAGGSTFWKKLGRNMKDIGQAMMMPEIYLVVTFFVLNGLISPDFGDFSYYFMLNVVNLSKFQYSMLGVVGQITSVFGVMFYEARLKDVEVRTVLYWSTICSIISSLSQYAFALRWNTLIGVNDIVFIVCTDTVFGVASLAMNTLPTLALFAKITPKKIEGTVFAFLTGTTNLANNVLAPMVGVWVNERFVGVTADDLSKYKMLCLIGLATSFLGFLILPLIPWKEDIKGYQDARKKLKLEEKMLKAKDAESPVGENAAKDPAKELGGQNESSEEGLQNQPSKGSSGDPDDIDYAHQGGDEEARPLIQAH